SLVKDLGLVDGILPCCRIEHEEGLVRGGGDDLAKNAVDLFKLFHQIGFILQAPCGVDEDDIAASRFSSSEGIEGNSRRVGAGGGLDDVDAEFFCPHCQLLNGSCAERICGGDEHFLAFFLVIFSEFGNGRRFAAAIDADDEEDIGV